jgi:hypothetical protein
VNGTESPLRKPKGIGCLAFKATGRFLGGRSPVRAIQNEPLPHFGLALE